MAEINERFLQIMEPLRISGVFRYLYWQLEKQ